MKLDAERVANASARREIGAWLRRVDRLLVGEQRVDIDWSRVRVTHRRAECTELHWDGVDGETLFDIVAAALSASEERIAAARGEATARNSSTSLKLDPTASTH